MSVQSQIERLENAKADIMLAIENQGITVPDGVTLDDLAELIMAIDTVRYSAQTPTSEEQEQARSNIDAAQSSHEHGNLTSAGAIGSTSGLLVETGENGVITASRKIVVGTTDPESMSGLNAGDIYIYITAENATALVDELLGV